MKQKKSSKKRDHKNTMKFYYLFLFCYEKENKETIVLDNDCIKATHKKIRNFVENHPPTELPSEVEEQLYLRCDARYYLSCSLDEECGTLAKRLGCSEDGLSAELFLYHHRMRIEVELNDQDEYTDSSLQGIIRERRRLLNEIIHEKVPDLINEINIELNGKHKILGASSYPVIIVPKPDEFEICLDNLIQTNTFRISDIKKFKNIYHYARISIPSTIIYSSTKLETVFGANLINCIYQYLLYDLKRKWLLSNGSKHFASPEIIEITSERDLVKLWDRMLDEFGCKISDEIIRAHELRTIWLDRIAVLVAILIALFVLVVQQFSQYITS